MITPTGNQCLIEVVDEFSGLSHAGQDGQLGIVREVSSSPLHLTASTGFELSQAAFMDLQQQLSSWIGKTVRYALYADADSAVWKEGGTSWVLIPWYRVLGIVESDVETTTDTTKGKIETYEGTPENHQKPELSRDDELEW